MKIFALISAVLLFAGSAYACNTSLSYNSCYNAQLSYAVPVTVVHNYSTTDYAEVPYVQLQKLETVAVPEKTVVSSYSAYATPVVQLSAVHPVRTVVEKVVEVPRRVVQRDVVVEKKVVERDVKVVRVQRNVRRNVNVNVERNVNVTY